MKTLPQAASRRPAVLLDLDGTLVDPKRGIVAAFRHAVAALGSEPPAAAGLNWIIGPPLRGSFAHVLGAEADIEAALRAYRARYVDGEGLYDADVYAGVPEALAALAQENRLFVCTSKPTPFAQKVIAHFGLAPFIARVYGAALDATFDDKADLLAHLVASESLEAEACVMVGDRRFDVDAGARNRVSTIGALWGYGDAEELRGATRLCARPADLPACVIALSRRSPAEKT